MCFNLKDKIYNIQIVSLCAGNVLSSTRSMPSARYSIKPKVRLVCKCQGTQRRAPCSILPVGIVARMHGLGVITSAG